MSTDILRFKQGETVEISVIFDVLDDLGISALTGVTAAAELRRKYTKDTVARFQTTSIGRLKKKVGRRRNGAVTPLRQPSRGCLH